MAKHDLKDFPPELLLLISICLPLAALNAFVSTCRRFHETLQLELESRITPAMAHEILLWASSSSRPIIVAKLLSPPHSIHPSNAYPHYVLTPLHVAAKAGHLEIAKLLLDAGADVSAKVDDDWDQPLHFATKQRDLEMVKLLLDHDAPIDAKFGCDGASETALHCACYMGDRDMAELLLERGANLEYHGHYGTALGFAVRMRDSEMVEFLLKKGANPNVTASLFILMNGGPPRPHSAPLLYIAMGLRHPKSDRPRRGVWKPHAQIVETEKWQGVPLGEGRKKLMSVLMKYGARKKKTMDTISRYLTGLAAAALYSEEEFLRVIEAMFEEAEEAVPESSMPTV
ncbi:ANK-REP-region domain-containing protein [Favolaschia claudopus]|uniref:ANK-REP-region domain-containing protein n=1 Tax=Favolaschia claudopus TaxID=2862362 RepID=A0AAW0BHM0_9AGAR